MSTSTNRHKNVAILLAIVLGISALEACGQACIKSARTHEIIMWAVVGGLFYMGVVALLFISYKYEGMGHVNMLWSCISIILAMTVGYFFFDEPMNKYTAVTFCFAILTIYFAHKAGEYKDEVLKSKT